MIFEHEGELRDRIEAVSGRRLARAPIIHDDSAAYLTIDSDSVLRLAEDDYFVLGHASEGRFGIDDQPKFWVKYVFDLTSGARKLIKLVFHEQFTRSLGLAEVRCTRSPEKEGAVLELVRGHGRFMQGEVKVDRHGQPVRVVDLIRGRSLYARIEANEADHESYVATELAGIMAEVVACIDAIAKLHALGQHHGDIRNDHILVDASSGTYRWIDFDYEVDHPDYDLWCMGNVLTYVVGKGMHTFRDVARTPEAYPRRCGTLGDDDALGLYRHRIACLGKLFPYLPSGLDEVLARFSLGASDRHYDLGAQSRDLRAVFGLPPAAA